MNGNYRVATVADMIEGNTVYCYYVSPTPDESNIGTLGPVDPRGWSTGDPAAHVYAADGSRVGYFNAERLAVIR